MSIILSVAQLTRRLKMRSAFVPYLFYIALLASISGDTTQGGLLVVSGEAAVRTIATRAIYLGEDRHYDIDTRTCPVSVTLASDRDDNYHFLDENHRRYYPCPPRGLPSPAIAGGGSLHWCR